MTMQRTAFAFLLLGAISSSIYGAKLLTGDVTTTGATTSFSFDLLNQVGYDSNSEILYVAAAANNGGAVDEDIDKFYLAGIPSGGTAFTAAAPSTATVNGTAGQTGPFYSKGFAFLGMANSLPVAVLDDSANTLYWVTSKLGASTQTVLSNADIKDANEGANAEISFATGVGGNTIIAAVYPNAGSFGDANSGIATLVQNAAGTSLDQTASVLGSDDIKAVPIDLTTSGVLAISNSVTVGTTVDMFWDAPLQRLYVALQVTGADDVGDGAKSIMVGRFDNGKLVFYSITPNDALTAATTDEIIGAKGADVTPKAHKVRVLHSTQGPSYLIVLGNASGSDAQKEVYALPLIDESKNPANTTTWKTSSTHGTLADKDDATTTYFKTTLVPPTQVFNGRVFTTAPTAAGDLLTESSEAAKVGRGQIPDVGVIQDIKVYKDTVFVRAIGSTEKAGVFYSQALFDNNGVVKGWTTWQRVVHPKAAETNFHAFAYAPILGNIFTVDGSTGNHTVNITQWAGSDNDGLLGGTAADSSVGLVSQLNSEFSGNGGIFGLFNFSSTHANAFDTGSGKVEMLVATGYKKVVLLLTMSESSVGEGPSVGNFSLNKATYTNGSVTQDNISAPCAMISLSGGNLDNLEAITSVEVVRDATDGCFLVVGGTKGLAVLRQATNNNSWDSGGLTTSFQNIDTETNTFVEVGDYTNVKKLWGDGANLYVMTDEKLDRILVNTLDGTISSTTVATLSNLGLTTLDSFADCAISGRFAVIATNRGLFRIANGSRIDTGTPTWTEFTTNTFATKRSLKQIYVVSPTKLKEQFAITGAGGQLYILESSLGLDESHLHIFDVAADGGGTIADTTLQLVTNQYVKRDSSTAATVSPYFSAGYYWNNFTTNGAFLTSAQPEVAGINGKFTRVPWQVQSGSTFRKNGEKPLDITVSELGIVRGITRSTAFGAELIYGDFGVRVHE